MYSIDDCLLIYLCFMSKEFKIKHVEFSQEENIMKRSTFTATAWEIFVWNLLLIFSVMFFIIPVVYVYPRYQKWFFSNVIIDDQRVEFVSDDEPYWGLLGWALFSLITFGIGSFYAAKQIAIWTASHIRFEGESTVDSSFTGNALEIFAYSLLSTISINALVFPFAWVIAITCRWAVSHITVSGKRLIFQDEGPWFGVVGWILFSLITLGIGSFYTQKKIYQYIFGNITILPY